MNFYLAASGSASSGAPRKSWRPRIRPQPWPWARGCPTGNRCGFCRGSSPAGHRYRRKKPGLGRRRLATSGRVLCCWGACWVNRSRPIRSVPPRLLLKPLRRMGACGCARRVRSRPVGPDKIPWPQCNGRTVLPKSRTATQRVTASAALPRSASARGLGGPKTVCLCWKALCREARRVSTDSCALVIASLR